MASRDTSPEAANVYFDRLKQMTPSQRVNIGVELWRVADSIQRAALRRQHPDATDSELTFQIAVSRFGPELARKAYRRE